MNDLTPRLKALLSAKSQLYRRAMGIPMFFKVDGDATKKQITSSIEDIFGVKVKSVRVLNTKFKNKRNRFGKYKTSTYKKAYVSLEDGKEINLENPFK